MTGQDTLDDTFDDSDRFEPELLVLDRDIHSISRADIELDIAHRLVNDLLKEGAVLPVPEERLLAHEPSAEAFESILQLAVVHRGWTAHDRDEGC
jgi:hypothetical protein